MLMILYIFCNLMRILGRGIGGQWGWVLKYVYVFVCVESILCEEENIWRFFYGVAEDSFLFSFQSMSTFRNLMVPL